MSAFQTIEPTHSTPDGSHAERRFSIEGRDLGYPTEFRDGSSAGGLFLVRSQVANELIAESGFEVAEVLPGRGILALNFVHYTDTDCGEYEEIATGFFVEPVPRRSGIPYLRTLRDLIGGRVASYTWKLQVTSRLSQQAGLQMWGFPKTIEEIDYERSQTRASFRLRMDGQDVLSYSICATGSQTPAPLSSPVYSIHEGRPVVSQLSQTYREAGYRPRGAELQLGPHPFARQLHALGLRRRPLLASWMGHLAFSMSAPEPL